MEVPGTWSVERIGAVAGLVWAHLDRHGSASLSALQKGVGVPERLVGAALGWLAREDKVVFEKEKTTVLVRLKSSEP